MKHGSLFSGIGGFDLAAEWMGWENAFHCEIEEFPRKVLKYYWPNATTYEDITKTDFTIWKGKIDILTGGFPCQPYSVAGKRRGKEDKRHLWPEMLRAIREITPKYVVGENVSGIINWGGGLVFSEVQTDLETQGYEVQPFILPAASVGGWHRRDRVWFIAHAIDSPNRTNSRQKGKEKSVSRKHGQTGRSREPFGADNTLHSDNSSERTERNIEKTISKLEGLQRCEDGRVYANIEGRSYLSTPVLCRSYDGISSGVDRVTAYGNAIVPQVAYEIFKAIELTIKLKNHESNTTT